MIISIWKKTDINTATKIQEYENIKSYRINDNKVSFADKNGQFIIINLLPDILVQIDDK